MTQTLAELSSSFIDDNLKLHAFIKQTLIDNQTGNDRFWDVCMERLFVERLCLNNEVRM